MTAFFIIMIIMEASNSSHSGWYVSKGFIDTSFSRCVRAHLTKLHVPLITKGPQGDGGPTLAGQASVMDVKRPLPPTTQLGN